MSNYFPIGGITTELFLVYVDPPSSGSSLEVRYWILTATQQGENYPAGFVFRNIVISESPVSLSSTVLKTVVTFDPVFSGTNTLNLNAPSGTVNFGYAQISNPSGLGEITVATNVTTSQAITYTQTTVSQWANQLLSGVPYTLATPSGTDLRYVFEDGTTTGTVRQVTPYFLPVTYYYGCTGTTVESYDTVSDTVILSYCSILKDLGTDNCPNVPKVGWTTADDCTVGNNYTYCSTDSTKQCTGNCKSDCPSGQTCNFATTYSCVADPPTKSFNLTTWQVVGIVIGAILVIAIIYFIFHSINKHKKSKKDPDGDVASDLGDNSKDKVKIKNGNSEADQ